MYDAKKSGRGTTRTGRLIRGRTYTLKDTLTVPAKTPLVLEVR